MKLLVFIGIVLLGLAVGYLFTTALVAVLLALAGKLFGFYPGWDVWLLGLFVFVVLWVVRHAFATAK